MAATPRPFITSFSNGTVDGPISVVRNRPFRDPVGPFKKVRRLT